MTTIMERVHASGYDGYDAMEAGEKEGWRAIAGWGRDGWDLGSWPYVVIYHRIGDDLGAGPFEMAVYCEGDVTTTSYSTREALDAATDVQAIWGWQNRSEDWVADLPPVNTEADLDAVPERLRGPFSWSRLNRESALVPVNTEAL